MMSVLRNINNVLRISCYKPWIHVPRTMSSAPVPSKPEAPETPKPPKSIDHTAGATHKPNNLEKRFLVWTKKYKSVDEVPEYISEAQMERARNQSRIKIANYMMVLTVVGCIFAVYSGKKAAQSGQSVVQANLDWHKKYNESTAKAE